MIIRFAGILLLIVAGLPFGGLAQQVLKLEEAITVALENNYQIRLVDNDRAIAANNVSLGNAGMLPRISADVSAAAGVQNTTQTLLSGETRALRGARNQSLAYGANLQWTLFDGFQMFTRYEQLKQLETRGEALWKAEVLKTVYAVYSIYYELARQKQLMRATETALQLSQFRLQTAEHRYQIGRASRLEVLSARVDLNADTTLLLRQQDDFYNMQAYLNELLVRDIDEEFDVVEDMVVDQYLDLDELSRAARQLNPDIRIALLDLRLAELESKRVKGQRYPVIDLSTAYTRSRSHAELGFSTESRGNGLNVGLSASVNIFNGFIQRKNERNAAIEVASAGLRVEEAEQRVEVELLTAYRTYLTQLELVRLEELNQQLAQENLDITMEKFRLGSIAPLEFREAQRNFVEASTRYSTALLQCKMAETTLKQIAGTLVLD